VSVGAAPALGVISDSPLQRHMLQCALKGNGVDLLVSCSPETFFDQISERVDAIDCWIVALEDESIDLTEIMLFLDEQDAPFLFGLELAPQEQDIAYVSWQRRLLTKLKEQIDVVEKLEGADSIARIIADNAPSSCEELNEGVRKIRLEPRYKAEEVWVLAASLGGPSAVEAFLDRLPSGLEYGFLYAQHVDAHFSKVLTDVLGRHAKLDLHPVMAGEAVMAGEVQVVPVDHQTEFSDQGCIIKREDWSGPYGPSIDQLLANLFAYYGNRCNVIVFSGMGNDGSMTIPEMKKAGCRVWTQTPESCASSSMPQSVLDLGCSDLSAEPSELADALIKLAARERKIL
jgi:chemosensory pili system protein ChpB (putative protein-glutamate methylesterase)